MVLTRAKDQARTGSSRQGDWQLRQAEEWLKAKQGGLEDDELVAATFGKESKDELTETELAYADKLRDLMEEKIEAVKRRDQKARSYILEGKKLYAKGAYAESLSRFEAAIGCTTADTLVGGEAKMWLALALDGSGKSDQARAIYVELKEGHPLPSIRSQAGDLLYILDAPKLKIKSEERLKIPDLTDVDDFRNRRRSSPRPTRPRRSNAPKKPRKPTWEDKFVENSPILRTFRNRYVQVAFLVVSVGVSVYSAYYL